MMHGAFDGHKRAEGAGHKATESEPESNRHIDLVGASMGPGRVSMAGTPSTENDPGKDSSRLECPDLAQVNISRCIAPLTSAQLKGFVAALPEVNAIADSSNGFVWRFQGDTGDATYYSPFPEDPLVIFNMSVWKSPDDLKAFMGSDEHKNVMRQRRQWFTRMEGANSVMWWIPGGTIPTPEEGLARLKHLETHGESPLAFSSFSNVPDWNNDLLRIQLRS